MKPARQNTTKAASGSLLKAIAMIVLGLLMGLVAGAGTGAIIGGLVGALTHVGVPEVDASHYNEGVRRGGILVAVKAENAQAHQMAQILSTNGAVNIDERAAQYQQEGYVPTAGNGVPGIQTGGYDRDGSPDSRGIAEKIEDGLTGDDVDDKKGQLVR